MSPSAPMLEDRPAPLASATGEPSSSAPSRSSVRSPETSAQQFDGFEPAGKALHAAAPPLSKPAPEAGPVMSSGCEASGCTLARAAAAEPLLPEAQRRWAARSLPERLQVVRQARHWMAAHPELFSKSIAPELARVEADTVISEVMPLLAAMRFLERSAARVLAPQKLGSAGRPLWLSGVQAEIHREPLGHVLVIGPANFPLFLPGVHVLQALVAGNAVTWKPGTGGSKVAVLLSHVLREAGLPRGVLHVAEESVEAARQALGRHPDKVVFTGSLEAGKQILGSLAQTATPSTMELSGADAVVLLPSADLAAAAKAVAFGLRLNGGEVCMSPRRVVATPATMKALRPHLERELAKLPPVLLKPRTAALLSDLVARAQQAGATVMALPADPPWAISGPADSRAETMGPLVLEHATPDMAITRSDVFAPVLSLIEAPSVLHMAEMVNNNPYRLTAAIFGNPREAQTLAAELRVGTVVINDLIAPTADPRIPFGGRGQSGFGLTRGTEGLLEMTAAKTILRRSRLTTLHYDPLGKADLSLFAGLVGLLYGGDLRARWAALKQVAAAGRQRSRKNKRHPDSPLAAHREKRA